MEQFRKLPQEATQQQAALSEDTSAPPFAYEFEGQLITVKEEHVQHSGHQIAELQELPCFPSVIQKLYSYEEHTRAIYNLPALDVLFTLHHHNKSLSELANMVNISHHTLKKVFDLLEMPTLSKNQGLARYNASLSTEQKREKGAKAAQSTNTSLTPEQRSENGRRGGKAAAVTIGLLSPEQKSERTRKAREALTPEQKRE